MTQEENRMAGRPFEGRNQNPEGEVPGTRPTDEEDVPAPSVDTDEHDTGSRAAAEGAMPSRDTDKLEPSPGVPPQPDSPSPEGATEGNPPGGSVANQSGRAPDQEGGNPVR